MSAKAARRHARLGLLAAAHAVAAAPPGSVELVEARTAMADFRVALDAVYARYGREAA
jgi:hypothetical protein